jgi:protein TonB
VGAAGLTAWFIHKLPSFELRRMEETAQTIPVAPAAKAPLSPAAPAKTADGVEITNATWVRAPVPEMADIAATDGVVRLQCMVTTEGRLAECVIMSETPAGAGLGQAALAAAYRAELKPATVGGRPKTSKITYTTRFMTQ